MAQTRVPGVSVSQMARRYDVSANLVFRWLRDPRFNRLVEDHAAVSFLAVAVAVVAEPPILGSPVIDAPIVDALVIEAAATGSQIEIVTPTGHRINVSGTYDPVALCCLVWKVG